ncbi:putative quinol monooxygenase [uncultured Tateyamaria sp.]|uniref:putative quinol monooxygenase n=1 Tax=uncultured Tateyamaria sp. TaxID=455651 RepID=UPI002639A21A|nr:putative quinol monooxygenase [uncultured Tateyamaria sp.]
MPYAVTVIFDLKPGTQDTFLSHIIRNARRSRYDEPGCQQFDVCTDPSQPDTVFLYELYDDLAAFEAHQQTPHYLETGPKIADMVAKKTLNTFELVHR